MNACNHDYVTLTAGVPGEYGTGTPKAVVEAYGGPTEGYAVAANIPDDAASTGFRHGHVLRSQ